MKKLIILASLFALAIILLSISIVKAVEIGISPAQLEFKADAGQEICKKLKVYSGEEDNLIGMDKWSSEKAFVKDIRKYTLNSNELEITFKYPKEIYAKRQLEFNVCIISKKSGTHYGSLIYSTNKSAAVGTWIILKVNGNAAEGDNENDNGSDEESVLNKITGRITSMSSAQLATIPMLISTIILIIFLIYFLNLSKKIGNKTGKSKNKNPLREIKKNINGKRRR